MKKVGVTLAQAGEQDVGVADVEAADAERLQARRQRSHDPHRWIVLDDLADGLGLLILDQLGRVARLVERRVHHAAIAEDAELSARRHLAARVRRRQIVDRRLRRHGIALHLHRVELHGARRDAARRLAQHDGAVSGEAAGDPGAGQELIERLDRRHRAGNGLRLDACRQRQVDRDLKAGLPAERVERAAERLRRNVEGAPVLRALRFEKLGLAARGTLRSGAELLPGCRRRRHKRRQSRCRRDHKPHVTPRPTDIVATATTGTRREAPGLFSRHLQGAERICRSGVTFCTRPSNGCTKATSARSMSLRSNKPVTCCFARRESATTIQPER